MSQQRGCKLLLTKEFRKPAEKRNSDVVYGCQFQTAASHMRGALKHVSNAADSSRQEASEPNHSSLLLISKEAF